MDFKVGDLIQLNDWENKLIRDGEVVNVTPSKILRTYEYYYSSPEVKAEMTAYATVKWLDGSQSEEDITTLERRDTELERQFRAEANAVTAKIGEKLSEAMRALHEAEKLSEESGIPFCSSISPLSQSFSPTTFNDKWGKQVDSKIVQSVTDAENEWAGWQHSAICF